MPHLIFKILKMLRAIKRPRELGVLAPPQKWAQKKETIAEERHQLINR